MGEHTISTVEEKAERAAYMRNYRRGKRIKALKPLTPDESQAQTCEPLDVLLSLEVSDPTTLPRLLRGLRWHIAYGTLTANAASQIMRFAEAEAAASTRVGKDPLASLVSTIVATPPPKLDD